MIIAQHLTVDQLSVILACMEEVSITDVGPLQRNTQRQLCRALKRKVPDHFQRLIDAGKITDRSEEENERQPQSGNVA